MDGIGDAAQRVEERRLEQSPDLHKVGEAPGHAAVSLELPRFVSFVVRARRCSNVFRKGLGYVKLDGSTKQSDSEYSSEYLCETCR